MGNASGTDGGGVGGDVNSGVAGRSGARGAESGNNQRGGFSGGSTGTPGSAGGGTRGDTRDTGRNQSDSFGGMDTVTGNRIGSVSTAPSMSTSRTAPARAPAVAVTPTAVRMSAPPVTQTVAATVAPPAPITATNAAVYGPAAMMSAPMSQAVVDRLTENNKLSSPTRAQSIAASQADAPTNMGFGTDALGRSLGAMNSAIGSQSAVRDTVDRMGPMDAPGTASSSGFGRSDDSPAGFRTGFDAGDTGQMGVAQGVNSLAESGRLDVQRTNARQTGTSPSTRGALPSISPSQFGPSAPANRSDLIGATPGFGQTVRDMLGIRPAMGAPTGPNVLGRATFENGVLTLTDPVTGFVNTPELTPNPYGTETVRDFNEQARAYGTVDLGQFDSPTTQSTREALAGPATSGSPGVAGAQSENADMTGKGDFSPFDGTNQDPGRGGPGGRGDEPMALPPTLNPNSFSNFRRINDPSAWGEFNQRMNNNFGTESPFLNRGQYRANAQQAINQLSRGFAFTGDQKLMFMDLLQFARTQPLLYAAMQQANNQKTVMYDMVRPGPVRGVPLMDYARPNNSNANGFFDEWAGYATAPMPPSARWGVDAVAEAGFRDSMDTLGHELMHAVITPGNIIGNPNLTEEQQLRMSNPLYEHAMVYEVMSQYPSASELKSNTSQERAQRSLDKFNETLRAMGQPEVDYATLRADIAAAGRALAGQAMSTDAGVDIQNDIVEGAFEGFSSPYGTVEAGLATPGFDLTRQAIDLAYSDLDAIAIDTSQVLADAMTPGVSDISTITRAELMGMVAAGAKPFQDRLPGMLDPGQKIQDRHPDMNPSGIPAPPSYGPDEAQAEIDAKNRERSEAFGDIEAGWADKVAADIARNKAMQEANDLLAGHEGFSVPTPVTGGFVENPQRVPSAEESPPAPLDRYHDPIQRVAELLNNPTLGSIFGDLDAMRQGMAMQRDITNDYGRSGGDNPGLDPEVVGGLLSRRFNEFNDPTADSGDPGYDDDSWWHRWRRAYGQYGLLGPIPYPQEYFA